MKNGFFRVKPNIAKIQDEVIAFWKEDDTFTKSVTKPHRGETIFYDGPPFPTGKPHHGTVLVSFIKDMIARYHTMRGNSVPRVWGWDCHGLPIENQAEKLLGINDKSVIEKSFGIGPFNDKCFDIVSNNDNAWREYIEQMARWVDYDGAYKTMSPTYMESVMWAFKECYNKGLIYQDYRVTPYCCHCETSLSISDARESDSTRPRQDRWVAVKFQSDIRFNDMPLFFLAWTTTPWTLPSNMALAVGKDVEYAFVKVNDEVLVAGRNVLANYKKVFGEKPEILKVVKGSELVGINYTPLFPYFADKKAEGAFRVIEAAFVGADDGMAIVHIAPAFGEDDYWACKNNKVPLVNPVDSKGCFTEEIVDFYDASCQKNVIEHNSDIIRFLYSRGIAVADGTIEHNYPHCWRCKNPLIYKAMDAWYFSIEKIKDRLVELNESINWVPDTVKHGRFGNWLENARDWNISRNRYWSTPIPLWECDHCHKRTVLGSVDEIEKVSGVRLTNLHRQYMDAVTFPCSCGGTAHRVNEVLDCWFESGSVPFAQKHYPFENKEWFDTHFPSDFIVEYTGQIRCWFYYLHVLSTALFDKPAFKNCIVHGTVLAKDGKKLSKSSKNYTDPMELLRSRGTDAFRMYMYQSSAMLLGDLQFDENGLLEVLQQAVLPLWNACSFLDTYAEIDGVKFDSVVEPDTTNVLDAWILAKLYETEKAITSNMEGYNINHYAEHIISLIGGLTNWYIRRSRRRFWASEATADKQAAYTTLYYVLVNICKLSAPVMPVISEYIYKALTEEESVHLADWPTIPERYKNETLITETDIVMDVIRLVRSIRKKNNVKNRIPLRKMQIAMTNEANIDVIEKQKQVICDEVNLKEVELVNDIDDIATISYLPNFQVLKAKFGKKMPLIADLVRKQQVTRSGKNYSVTLADGEVVVLDSDDVLINYKPKSGLHIASSSIAVIALDLELTDELRQEGLANDIVRNIQDMRKQMECNVSDRIRINYTGKFPDSFLDYVLSETLADLDTEMTSSENTIVIDSDDDTQLTILVRK